MEILKQDGCVVYCLNADGCSICQMNKEKQQVILDKIINKLDVEPYELIDYLVRTHGDYECSDKPCECCGDYIESWKMEIND